jgi:hypothetical protein
LRPAPSRLPPQVRKGRERWPADVVRREPAALEAESTAEAVLEVADRNLILTSTHLITCAEDDVTVLSPGPDRKTGTADDIVAPPETTLAKVR